MLHKLHLVARAAAAHQFYRTRIEHTLEERLVEVHRLHLEQRNLRHLDVEDAILLDEAAIRDGKLRAAADEIAKAD